MRQNGIVPQAVMKVQDRVLTVQDRRQILDEILQKYGAEPAEELLKMAMATRTNQHGEEVPMLSTKERVDIWKELLSYRMPKLKAVQLEGKIDTNINITIVRYGEDGKVQSEPGVVPKPIVDVPAEVISEDEKGD